jgi:biopolymer transport protein ExbD
MRSPNYLKPTGFALNLTPMIDIVFLLIIFFLVSSNLIQQDVSVALDLPAAETADPMKESETYKITVNVQTAGHYLLGIQPVSTEQLRRLFTDRRNEWGEKTEVRIRTDKEIPYGTIEPLLVLAAECNIVNVSFAVQEKR